jgi:multidrug resistance efflux pump
MRRRFVLAALAAAVAVLLVVWLAGRTRGVGGIEAPVAAVAAGPVNTQRQSGDRASGVRLSGTVEAVRATTVMVPRLAGQNVSTLVVTRMARPGSRVAPGDLLIEFDPQDQMRNAMDRRAEVVDLEGQIKKRRAELAIQRAGDETGLAQAEHDLERARLDLLKKEFVSPVEAEKNQLAFEQATAKLAQLKETASLRLKAGEADVRTLEIRRDRSAMALKHAEDNAKLMTVSASFPGVVVIKSTWKGNNMSEIQVGDDLRPGLPVLDVVDPSAMQVRVRINQADLSLVRPGLPATIHLDAYPDLTFNGRVELLAPLGVTSGMTAAVHFFTAVVSIQGTHEKLMPDLTASVDIGVAATSASPVAASGGGH